MQRRLRGFLKPLTLGLVLATSSSGQGQYAVSRKADRPEILRWDGQRPNPVWSGRALLYVELNRTSEPIIHAIRGDGQQEEVRFSIPEIRFVYVRELAGSGDGTVALCGSAYNGDSQGGSYLAIIPPIRAKAIVVRLVPYYPSVVTVAPDGTIWTVGYDGEKKQDSVLKRFDGAGNLLLTVKLAATGRLGTEAADASLLRAGKDRIGWMTSAYEYIEISLDGQEIGRYSGPPWHPLNPLFAALAIGEHGEVVASVRQDTQLSQLGLWVLDRKRRSWATVSMHGDVLGPATRLLGFDAGDLMAFEGAGDGATSIFRLGLAASAP